MGEIKKTIMTINREQKNKELKPKYKIENKNNKKYSYEPEMIHGRIKYYY